MTKQKLFSIDGRYFDFTISDLKRNFTIQDTEKAGRSMSGGMIRDIIGTYYNYTMEIDASRASRSEYDIFYDIISAPQDSHHIIAPYAQGVIEFDAYISSGEDSLRVDPKGNHWTGISVTFTAMEPQSRP